MYFFCPGTLHMYVHIYKAKSGESRIIIGPTTFVENGQRAGDVYLDSGKQSKITIKPFSGGRWVWLFVASSQFWSILFNADIRSLSLRRVRLPYLTAAPYLVEPFFFTLRADQLQVERPSLPRPLDREHVSSSMR